ncbi:MAG: phosphoribosylformimino-5-aminoimidazole carboxamide ribotide isomerase [Spirochaetales bacterium]|nr:phosphoribosylformimino-5-aminoimidazole carboxamide ribotide isomerase [Spirochaetales bacterium]
MKLRPCIDLHDGRVKQIVGGTLQDGAHGQVGSASENFVSDKDASWYAELYKEKNLTGGHIIKLGPANDDQAMAALKAWPGGLQIGGGINGNNALDWLERGASHVIITSALFKDGDLDMNELERISRITGKERLVLDLSCRKRGKDWVVVTDRWQTFTNFTLSRQSMTELAGFCDEFLIHGVDVEGKRCGIEEELVSLLARIEDFPITYAGGVASLEDVKKISTLGNNKIDFTIGSALDIFGGTLSLNEVLALT